MYGELNGDSAMAQTVGKPTAIAAKMILSGKKSNNNYTCVLLSVYFHVPQERLRSMVL